MKKTSFGFITESSVGHDGFPDWQEFFTSKWKREPELEIEPAHFGASR